MKRNYYIVILIFITFFVISFLTNILGSINPNVSDSFHLSGAMTGLLPFSFFIAYGLMSIPAGMMVQKYKEKSCMMVAWALSTFGSFLFAFFPSFPIFLGSLFLIGSGMAFLQVAINPLLRISGGEEHFAFFSVFAQLIFGSASFISPFVYSYLVNHLNASQVSDSQLIVILRGITPASLSWVSIYWIFTVITLMMIVILVFTKMPEVKRKEDEVVGAWKTHVELLKNKTVILFTLGIFAYVGTEQGIANWISEFLRSYHGFSPEIEGAHAVGLFWGMMTIGCILGLVLLKLVDSRLVLRYFASMAIIVLALTLYGSAKIALYGFPTLGFCLSVMWSIIFSLSLNSVEKYHGTFAGILCTAIAGGAVVSLIIGQLKDWIGLRDGMLVLFITLGYVLSISFWAKPIITNQTISFRKKNNTI